MHRLKPIGLKDLVYWIPLRIVFAEHPCEQFSELLWGLHFRDISIRCDKLFEVIGVRKLLIHLKGIATVNEGFENEFTKDNSKRKNLYLKGIGFCTKFIIRLLRCHVSRCTTVVYSVWVFGECAHIARDAPIGQFELNGNFSALSPKLVLFVEGDQNIAFFQVQV